MRTVNYEGYQASVEFEDDTLFVKVLHIDDLLIAEVDRASEAKNALKELIDAYLLDCAEEGREPTKPFKGSFNVRVTPDLHRRVAMSAANEGFTLNKWVCAAIEEKLECNRFSDRMDDVFAKQKERLEVEAMAVWHSRSKDNLRPMGTETWTKKRVSQHHWIDSSGFEIEDTFSSFGLVSIPREKLHG